MTPRSRLVGVLALALVSISTAAPLIVAAGMPGPAIALWRLAIAGSILFLVAWVNERDALRALTRRDYIQLALAGALFGAHFLLWMGSLSLTSVLSSTVIVTSNPIWVAIGAAILLREPPTRRTWVAILMGVAGTLVLAFADLSRTEATTSAPAPLLGDALALGGALAGSGALLAGRALRARIPFATYLSLLSLFAIPFVLAAALVARVSLVPPTQFQLGCVVALAIVPHVFGNGSLAWALGHLSAPRVALVILGEPVGASLLAWIFLDQSVSALSLAGGALVLAAVALGVLPAASK